MTEELPVPPALADEAKEACRIFRQPDGRVVVVLAPMVFGPDPASWGLILVDLAHHVAQSLEDKLCDENGEPADVKTILERIHSFAEAEWKKRTDTVRRLGDS